METDHDILIIGGGLAGASLACALGPSGLRIGVVEAVPFGGRGQPSYDDRNVALAYGSKRIFATMGVWEDVVAGGAAPIKQIHISDRGHFGASHLHHDAMGVEALGYVVPNRVLGVALLAGMERYANVDLICPATMQDIQIDHDAARVQVDRDGEVVTLTTRLLVIADGGRSAAREMLGIEARTVDYRQTAVVANATPERPHDGVAFERFTPTGPLALLPLTNDRCAMVWSTRPEHVDELLALSDEEFASRLHARFGDRLGRFQRVGKRNAYPLTLVRVREHVRARVALIGNAAHALHPVAGQGFNLGLRDVAALAQVVTDAVRADKDIGDLMVLQEYADWRRRDTLAVTRFTDSLVRMFSNSFFPAVAARNLGLVAVDLIPPLKRSLVHRTMGLAGKLPRLARGLSL